MRVQHALDIVAGRMNCAVDGEPAGLIGQGLSETLLPCMSIFTKLEAVISSNIMPYGLIRK